MPETLGILHELLTPGSTFASVIFLAITLTYLLLSNRTRLRSIPVFSVLSRIMEIGFLATPNILKAQTLQESSEVTSSCHICNAHGSLRCSRCKVVKYCSATCQRKHWSQGHKGECQLRPKSSMGNISMAALTLRPPMSSEGSLKLPQKILFPYDRFLDYFAWDGFEGPPCGLLNSGNSCYANAVLQCLAYTRPLTAYLLEGSHSESCKRRSSCLLCHLEDHMESAFSEEEEEAEGRHRLIPFSASKILRIVQKKQRSLGYGRQEDAHEFMRFVVDEMQTVCLDEFGGEKNVEIATQDTTVIHHIFGGVLRSQVQCMECHHESARYESILDVAVEVDGKIATLDAALKQFTATEWLDGDNKYKCDKCNSYVIAGKRLVIEQAPNFLTISLKRFQAGRFGKLNKKVSFPSELDLTPYMSAAANQRGEAPIYDLYAVIVHYDMLNSSFFGHYICYVRGFCGKWYRVDDCEVEECRLEVVLQQKAYLLFYSRKKPHAAPKTASECPETDSSMFIGGGEENEMQPEGSRTAHEHRTCDTAMADSALTKTDFLEIVDPTTSMEAQTSASDPDNLTEYGRKDGEVSESSRDAEGTKIEEGKESPSYGGLILDDIVGTKKEGFSGVTAMDCEDPNHSPSARIRSEECVVKAKEEKEEKEEDKSKRDEKVPAGNSGSASKSPESQLPHDTTSAGSPGNSGSHENRSRERVSPQMKLNDREGSPGSLKPAFVRGFLSRGLSEGSVKKPKFFDPGESPKTRETNGVTSAETLEASQTKLIDNHATVSGPLPFDKAQENVCEREMDFGDFGNGVKLTTANLGSTSEDEDDHMTTLLKKDVPKVGAKKSLKVSTQMTNGRPGVKQGRNDVCACGSKRKWKKCCGSKK